MDLVTLIDGKKALMRWLWASLLCNMGIVVTGGVVRLTGSGLGCSDWPLCTPDRLVPHAELGIHGAIEFGNRTLTIVLCIVALGAFLAARRAHGSRSKLWWVTLTVGIGIIVQAVVGGITVWMGLNPFIVAFHLTASIPLIVLCAWGVLLGRGDAPVELPRNLRGLVVATFCVAMASILTGTLTTGAGPHAGDADAPRNGLDIEAIARVHSVSAWLVVIFAVIALVAFTRARIDGAARLARMFVSVVALQGLIGYIQYFLGIPAGVVWLHMLGLTVFTAAAAWLLFGTRGPARTEVRAG